MRISLLTGGNANAKRRQRSHDINECALYRALIKSRSLTISYHAICVSTHIDSCYTAILVAKKQNQ